MNLSKVTTYGTKQSGLNTVVAFGCRVLHKPTTTHIYLYQRGFLIIISFSR